MSLTKIQVGQKIKELRKSKSEVIGVKYTQNMLAKDLEISRGYLGDIENGRIYPNFNMLSRICELCNSSLGFFDDDKSR